MKYFEMKPKLNEAFKKLRKAGYFARQSFWCCQSCGCANIPDTHQNKYVFYHKQDKEQLERRGECYLAWSGDGHEIKRILVENGLNVEWDGSEDTRIKVS